MYVIYGTWVVVSWHDLTEGVQVLMHQNNVNTLSLENYFIKRKVYIYVPLSESYVWLA